MSCAVHVTAVIPVAGPAPGLPRLLHALRGRVQQIVVSVDEQTQLIELGSEVVVVQGSRGRGQQIARGVAITQTDLVWVLHADTCDIEQALEYLCQLSPVNNCWGRFDVCLRRLGLISRLMNWRSRLTRICTGDQAMFFHQRVLEAIGGYPQQSLMEDIEVSRMLKRHARAGFLAPRIAVTSSSNRWLSRGVARTVLYMWVLRMRYYFGADPDVLYRMYYR